MFRYHVSAEIVRIRINTNGQISCRIDLNNGQPGDWSFKLFCEIRIVFSILFCLKALKNSFIINEVFYIRYNYVM